MTARSPDNTNQSDLAREMREHEVTKLRREFRAEVNNFLQEAGVPLDTSFEVTRDAEGASPVYIVTGASFTKYDPELHGKDETHAFAAVEGEDGETYLMNNTAAVFERLAQSGERVLVHSKDAALVEKLAERYGVQDNVKVIGGDLGGKDILPDIYRELEAFADEAPVNDVRMALYQSFAQNNGEPFKPMHREAKEEVEGAANRRIRFVYNVAALGYDLLMNRKQDSLRVVSLSALAASRATYGLLADASDKYMNELGFRTFHLEANISTGKPVSIYQVNPGITTACGVYRDETARKIVKRESIADGFPMDDDVFTGKKDLPQISSHEVAWVVDALLRTPENEDPNEAMPEKVRKLLYGGFEPEEFQHRFEGAISKNGNVIEIDPDRRLPEHVLTPQTSYGRLPKAILPGDYRRISLSPPGQKF